MSFEISQERPTPKLWLAKPDKTIMQRINGVENLNGTFNFMNQTTVTFDINSHVFNEMTQEQKKNPVLSKIRNKYLIKFVYNEQEEWLIINDRSNLSQEKDYISVTAEYIGSELNMKRIGDIEEIGSTISSLMNKFLPSVALNWSVKYIDPKLASIKREYNLTDASVSSLLESIGEQTDAVVVFHNYDRQLSFVHRDNAGKFQGLKVKEATYLKSFTDTQDSSDLITRLVLFGNDGLTINGINPAGTSYIDDFTYYMRPFRRDSRRNVLEHSDYMSDELCHALLDYQEYFDNRKDDYEDLSEDYNNLIKEQLQEDFKLSEISATLSNLEERNEILKPRGGYTEKVIRGNTSFGALYNTHYMMVVQNKGGLARVAFAGQEQLISPNEYIYIKLKTPAQVDVGESDLSYDFKVTASNPNLVVGFSTSSEEDFREEDIDELDKKYNVFKYRELYASQYSIVTAVAKRLESYNQQRENINNSLSAQQFFTPQLLKERENFTNWGVWREDNHTDPKELLEDGLKQMKEKNNVVRTTQVDIIDFIQSLAPEDQKNWKKLVAGSKIRFSNETYEADLEAFISEMSINFDNHDVTLTLSDIIDLRDKNRGVANQLASFMSTANQVNLQKNQLDENASKTNQVMALLEGEWDANKKRILAGNETVDIGSHGIKITSPTHPNEMLMAVAGVIAISDDYGETFKQAINTRGVVAERLIGKVIMSTELIMENKSGTFRFDDDGVRINAANFHLIADDGENYFDNLMNSIGEQFITYEERIKEDIKNQKESFDSEIKDVETGLQKYTNNLLDALADGLLSEQEIHSLKLQLNMLEADYAQVRRRVIPMLQNIDLDPAVLEEVYVTYYRFESDYEMLVEFIIQLEKPQKVSEETIKKIKDLVIRFKPSIEELVSLVELALNNTQQNRIENAEYNSRTFAENLYHDLEDEVGDLTDALSGFDLGFTGALADGVLDMIERSQISDALMRLESEKQDVDNRYDILITHEHLTNTTQRTQLQTEKQSYNSAFNDLVRQINFILARDKFTVEMINDYKLKYKQFTTAIVSYSAKYEETLEFVQNTYADTKLGEAEKYADGLRIEVEADIKDVHDGVLAFEKDVYGAFSDGIITERERARLKIHHDMLEKEKSDVIERYNTIITNQYLQGFYDTEDLVRARAEFGEIHAELLLSLELAMMDNVITKEEADLAVSQFGLYVEKLTAFEVELSLGIAAIGESKAVYQTEQELKNYISLNVFNDEIAKMQASLDGHIMTWYYDYKPTLTNIPAKEWTTEKLKAEHTGDLFYHQSEGTAYRFMKKGSVYTWELIKDTEVTKALKDAQDAIDLADSKRRVFVTTPSAPYDIGDLWIMDNGELMRARTERGENEVYAYIDWIKATKYTDDTKANAVENMLKDFQSNVNTELEDLSGALVAFKKTIEGAFRDGVIEEYELQILRTQQMSLDREKADVDALYNQLLRRSDLTTIQRSTLTSRYTSFSTTHQTLKDTIVRVVEDGKITEAEYEDTMTALDNYPIELNKVKMYLNELIQALITKAQATGEEAARRFDTWRSTSFETDVTGIFTRVGESTWESKWLPEVNDKLSNIGSENLLPYSSTQGIVDNWLTVEQGADRKTILTKPTSGTPAYQNTARIYSSSVLADQYFGVRSPRFPRDIIEGETYTLSFKTTNHASSYTDMRYTYLMREGHSGTNQGSLALKSTPIARPDGVSAILHTVTFKANFSGGAGIMIATRSNSDIAAQFHLYEPMLVQGSVIPQWSESPQDKVEVLNTEIKSNYSTTKQTKDLLGSYVTSTEMQGNLDKIATGYGRYLVSNSEWASLKEAGGSSVSDTFSYEITARRLTNSDTLFVAVFNSRGTGKGWEREILEQKGTGYGHPEVYSTTGGDIRVRTYSSTSKYDIEVIYTKYAGSFTNLSKTNSMIEQKAAEINSEVKKKVGNDEIISRINQSAEKISINANKVNISGDSINISANPAISKLEKEEVGGANLLRGTTVDKDNLKYLVSVNGGTSNVTPIVSVLDGVPYYLIRETAGASSSYIAVRNNGDGSTIHIRKGQTYVLSFVARKSAYTNDFGYVYIMRPNTEGANYNIGSPSVTEASYPNANRYTFKFTAPWTTSAGYLLLGLHPSYSGGNQWFRYRELTLQEGDKAGSYAPHPDEVITTDTVVSSINLDKSGVQISGNLISLTGTAEFNSALKGRGITAIAGGKIETDQMTAKRINIVRDDGVVSINDGKIRAEYGINAASPEFMSRNPTQNMGGHHFWQQGEWWTTNRSIQSIGTGAYGGRLNYFEFLHTSRYLRVALVMNVKNTGFVVRIRNSSGTINEAASAAMRASDSDREYNITKVLTADLGTPTYKRMNFYLYFQPNAQGGGADWAHFRIFHTMLTDETQIPGWMNE